MERSCYFSEMKKKKQILSPASQVWLYEDDKNGSVRILINFSPKP